MSVTLEDALSNLPSEFANLRLYLTWVDSAIHDMLDRLEVIETKLDPIIVPDSGNVLVSVEEYERFKELFSRMEILQHQYEEAIVNIISAYRK